MGSFHFVSHLLNLKKKIPGDGTHIPSMKAH